MSAASVSSSRPLRPGRLYWQLSGTFLLLLALLAGVYVYVTTNTATRYFEATHQRLNKDVAGHIAKFMLPFKGREVNREAAAQTFFNVMVLNPSVEVYLLDPRGRILVRSALDPPYFAPRQKLARQWIDLGPVQQFIITQGTEFIQGDDPKSPAGRKIFSAAKVEKQGRLLGYVYVVLASETYDSTLSLLRQKYLGRLSFTTVGITLLAAFAIGLLAFYLITGNLRRLSETVQEFRRGNLAARVQVPGKGELAELGHTFNAMADTLAANLRALQTAEQLRRNLVANVSHDLRTPVAAIRGYAETIVLKNGSLAAADQQRYLGIILQHAEKLDKQVDELFELSKLEAADTPPHPELFVLTELVQDVFQKYQILAQQKGVDFRCAPCEESIVVRADIRLLERALQNLVDNAIKHTAAGGQVYLAVEAGPAATAQVILTNTYTDIPPLVMDYLLSFDQPLDNTPRPRPDGVGLGLEIVRRILRLHGSALQVEILSATSIRFAFALPLQ